MWIGGLSILARVRISRIVVEVECVLGGDRDADVDEGDRWLWWKGKVKERATLR